jgi:hypothetical protein
MLRSIVDMARSLAGNVKESPAAAAAAAAAKMYPADSKENVDNELYAFRAEKTRGIA